MTVATVSTKGQVTLPVAMRRALGIRPQDRVVMEVARQGILIRPAGDMMQLAGFLGRGRGRARERQAAMREAARRQGRP